MNIIEESVLLENNSVVLPNILLEQLHFETGQQFICTIKENGIYLIPKLASKNSKEKLPLKPRIAGLGQGSIRTTEDFDQPLPDSFWLGEQ